jgi:hypothetical protein
VDVQVRRELLQTTGADGSGGGDGERAPVVVTVSGTVEDVSMFGRRVLVHRTVRTRTDTPWLELRDTVENAGHAATPVPVLYHVNLGAPLVVPGSRVRSGAADLVRREPAPPVPDPTTVPEPADDPAEAVVEHRRLPVADGRARVRVSSPVLPWQVEVAWSVSTLPRLYQWTWPARRGWALGVEPSNAALFGPGHETPGRGAPLLQPGESWQTELTVRVLDSGGPR